MEVVWFAGACSTLSSGSLLGLVPMDTVIMVLCSCYDRIKGAELTCMELLSRRAQLIDPKYKDRMLPKPTKDMDAFNESQLHLGTSETHCSLLVRPALKKYVGEQLHFEPLAAKERRSAAEERSGAGANK